MAVSQMASTFLHCALSMTGVSKGLLFQQWPIVVADRDMPDFRNASADSILDNSSE